MVGHIIHYDWLLKLIIDDNIEGKLIRETDNEIYSENSSENKNEKFSRVKGFELWEIIGNNKIQKTKRRRYNINLE